MFSETAISYSFGWNFLNLFGRLGKFSKALNCTCLDVLEKCELGFGWNFLNLLNFAVRDRASTYKLSTHSKDLKSYMSTVVHPLINKEMAQLHFTFLINLGDFPKWIMKY